MSKTLPTVTATLLFQRWENDNAVPFNMKNVTVRPEWLEQQEVAFLRDCATSGGGDPIVEAHDWLDGHDGPFELMFHVPNSLNGKNTLQLWIEAAQAQALEPATGTAAVVNIIDQAANLLSSAGGDDPGKGHVYGLPETDTAEDDLTLALQLIRRAQDRLTSWDPTDLRALAADLIHRFGSGSADQEGMNDDYCEAANAEFPDLPPIDPGQLDEVRDFMRAAVIEINGTRYNDTV